MSGRFARHSARALSALFFATIGWTHPMHSSAQSFPAKPVRLVVPFGAGGGADSMARMISPPVSERLAQQVIIENRGGAGGTIGAGAVARAAPDGYTILLATFDLTIGANLYDKLPFDLVKDLAAVTMLAKTPGLLAVHPSLPAKSVKELIALARAHPGKINYAAAHGTLIQLAAELFKIEAKVDMVGIPYVSTAPSVIAVLGGEASAIFAPAIALIPHTKSGRMRALAITSAERSQALPDLPTIAEAGLPGYDIATWYGIMAPAATPEAVIARLQSDFVQALRTKEVSGRLINETSAPIGSGSADFAAVVKSDLGKMARLVKASGAKSY